MSAAHGHAESEHEAHGSAKYDSSYGRGTLIGIGIFVLIFALLLVYADSKLQAGKSAEPSKSHSSAPAEPHK